MTNLLTISMLLIGFYFGRIIKLMVFNIRVLSYGSEG
jgi:hypothetical protein